MIETEAPIEIASIPVAEAKTDDLWILFKTLAVIALLATIAGGLFVFQKYWSVARGALGEFLPGALSIVVGFAAIGLAVWLTVMWVLFPIVVWKGINNLVDQAKRNNALLSIIADQVSIKPRK